MRAEEPNTQRLGERILEDGDRLLRMVDNLLDTTRLEEGHHTLEMEPISVRAIVEAGISELTERAVANGIQVEHDVPAELSLVADRAAFESVLRNILDNAIKACIAGEGQTVSGRARAIDGQIEMKVTDDGIGFPPQDAAMIFEKFYRSGDEIRRATPGTGLGLEAASEGPGKGATFTVNWPAAKQETAAS